MKIKKQHILWMGVVAAGLLSISAFAISIWSICQRGSDQFEKAKKSVVTIITGIDMEKEILTSDVTIGTGFCYKQGKIVTNYHNVQKDDAAIHVITYNNKTIPARIIAKDETCDIAILEIDAEIPALSFADTDQCKIGQPVSSISTPISAYLRGTFSEGLITNLNIVGFGTQRLLQTNIDLSPGCSGGPLFDSKYRVLGMTTFKSTEFGAEGLGFAIPGNQLQEAIDRLERGSTVMDLGLTFQKDIYQKYGLPGAEGLLIQEIGEESPAKDLLLAGDLLIKINDQPVKSIVEYYERLQQTAGSQSLKVTVIRNEAEQTIELKGVGS